VPSRRPESITSGPDASTQVGVLRSRIFIVPA
jgi:hypothetical protein